MESGHFFVDSLILGMLRIVRNNCICVGGFYKYIEGKFRSGVGNGKVLAVEVFICLDFHGELNGGFKELIEWRKLGSRLVLPPEFNTSDRRAKVKDTGF